MYSESDIANLIIPHTLPARFFYMLDEKQCYYYIEMGPRNEANTDYLKSI